MRRLYKKYIQTCRRRNVFWELTVEQFHKLTSQPCVYCGKAPAQISRNYIYNGIDRINHYQGYVLANCATACVECNFIKGTRLTYDEMLVVARALAAFRKRRRCRGSPSTSRRKSPSGRNGT